MTTGFASSNLTIWINNGLGGFSVLTNIPVGGEPEAIETADLNGDTHVDFVTILSLPNVVSAFLGDGNGNFYRTNSLPAIPTGALGLTLGDFNSDGIPDAAIEAYGLQILLGDGDGRFTFKTNYAVGSYDVEAADFNSDNKLDLVTANYSSSSMSVCFGNGNGTFAPPAHYSGDHSEYHYSVAVGDFNNDGKPDLTTVNLYSSSISVRTNNGNGTFGAETRYNGTPSLKSVTVGDFNADGNLDIIAGTASGSYGLTILPGLGNGTFGSPITNLTTMSAGVWSQSLAVGDLDGDELVDIVTAGGAANRISVRLNQSVAFLDIQSLPGKVVLSWPNWSPYQLQRRTHPSLSLWSSVAGIPTIVGNKRFLTNSILGNNRVLYRLSAPLP